MEEKLTRYPNLLMDWLCTGRLDLIAYAYSFPAVIFLGDRLFHLPSRRYLLSTLAAYRAILVRHGLHHARVKVLNKPRWLDRRFNVIVQNTYCDETGQEIGRSSMRFFVQRDFLYPSIKMVEMREWPFPEEIAASPALKALEATSPLRDAD